MNEQRPVITKLEALRTLIQETQTRADHNWWHGDDFATPLQLVEEALTEASKESVVVFPDIQVTSVASGASDYSLSFTSALPFTITINGS